MPVGVPECRARRGALTDAGGHRRAALLVALGTAIAGEAGHAVLAWALPRGLVAGLAGRTNWVAVASWVGERGMVMGEGRHNANPKLSPRCSPREVKRRGTLPEHHWKVADGAGTAQTQLDP